MANVVGWFAEVSTAVTVPQMGATALMKPPGVSTVSPFIIAVPRMSATAALKTPSLTFSTTVSAPRMAATAAMAPPVISNAVNANVNAPRMSATAAMPVPAVAVSYAVSAPRMAGTAAMATPVVATINGASFSDNFNRSDSSTLGASWNTDTGLGTSLTISSNAAVTDSSGSGGDIYTTPMSTGNNEITVVMKGTPSAGDVTAILARTDSSTDSGAATKFVEAFLQQGQPWALYRSASDSGVFTGGNESWSAGDTIVFSCVGGTLTVKRNGSTVLTTSGATDLAAGYVELGVAASSAGIGFDSFTAQDI